MPTYSNRSIGAVRLKLDQDIDVAGWGRLTAGDGAKPGRVRNPATAEFRFVGTRRLDDFFAVHDWSYTRGPIF